VLSLHPFGLSLSKPRPLTDQPFDKLRANGQGIRSG
jgi:hypothetical protein